MPSGQLDLAALQNALDDSVAAVIVQSPNFFGCIEDITPIADAAHQCGALLIAGFTDGTSSGHSETGGCLRRGFCCGRRTELRQSAQLRRPLSGRFSPRAKNFCAAFRARLAGATVDKNGKRGFVLTLQTREQHIRREKATSNICSNEALCALAAGVYLAALGKNLRKLAALNIYKTQYLKNKLLQLDGLEGRIFRPRL